MAKRTERDAIAKRILLLMEENGLNQKDLSRELGWTDNGKTINKILQKEDGTTKSGRTIQRMWQIAKYFNVSLDWLYGLSNIRNNRLIGDEGKISKVSNTLGLNYKQLQYLTGSIFRDDTELPKYIKELLDSPYSDPDGLESFLYSVISYLNFINKQKWTGYITEEVNKTNDMKINEIGILYQDIEYVLKGRILETLEIFKESSIYHYNQIKEELAYVEGCLEFLETYKKDLIKTEITNANVLCNDIVNEIIKTDISHDDFIKQPLISHKINWSIYALNQDKETLTEELEKLERNQEEKRIETMQQLQIQKGDKYGKEN